MLESFQEGNWRLLIAITLLPGLVSWILVAVFLEETARFKIVSGEIEESFAILNRLNKFNGARKFDELSDETKAGLRVWITKFNE